MRLKLLLLAGLLFAPAMTFAESPKSTRPGIAKEKPASGPAVKVAEGFMVPYTVTIPGTDISFEMVPVPGGKFLMGSPETEAERKKDEGPQVQVTVDPMWVAKTEVSWAQYKEFMSLYQTFKAFQQNGERKVGADITDAVTAPTPLYDPSYTFEYGEEPEQPEGGDEGQGSRENEAAEAEEGPEDPGQLLQGVRDREAERRRDREREAERRRSQPVNRDW